MGRALSKLEIFTIHLGVLLMISCSSPERRSHSIPDGGLHMSNLNVCNPETIAIDMRNCGSCGNHCPPSLSDQCVDGECRCGQGEPCSQGEGCRGGRCIPADPEGINCEFDDQCHGYGEGCISARCTVVECLPEVCDGSDNDCDGLIDEGASPEMPLSAFCYDGNVTYTPLDIINPCRAGVQVCLDGMWTECLGEIPPRSEGGLFACDGVDNDCDGCVDGNVLEDGTCSNLPFVGFDILYVIDTSGSMTDEAEAVTEATLSFASELNLPSMRFGIVSFAASNLADVAPAVNLDLSPFPVFRDYLLGPMLPDGGSEEPSLDAIWEIGTNQIRHTRCMEVETTTEPIRQCAPTAGRGLSWREGSIRIIIMFTDEEAQSYLPERGMGLVTEEEACASLTHGEVLVVMGEERHLPGFDCDGRTLTAELSNEPEDMSRFLSTVLVDPCTGDQFLEL